MKRLTTLALAYATLLSPALVAAADWGANGLMVCGGTCVAETPRIIPDGSGGAFLAWRELRDYRTSGYDVYAQRITAQGQIAPGWPPEGFPVCTDPNDQVLFAIAPDGQGGILIVWQDTRNASTTSTDIYVQRILGDGALAPGWPVNGAPASRGPDYEDAPDITGDGLGGAYVSWEDYRNWATQGVNIYAQHLTATGTVAGGWPENGLAAGSFPSGGSQVLRADSGGVIVAWSDGRRGGVGAGGSDVYAQQFTSDGAIAPGWALNGLLLVPSHVQPQLRAASNGDFYLACNVPDSTTYFGFDLEYSIRRFTSSGQVAQGWPTDGVRVGVAAGIRAGPRVAEDNSGSLVLAWYDYRSPVGGSDVYAARVLPDGVLAPGWPQDGVLVSDPAQGLETDVDIAADDQGGAYVSWLWGTDTGSPSKIQHLTADGKIAPGWPANGVVVSQQSSQFDPAVAPDGQGGAIVAWDYTSLFAQHFSMEAPVPALPEVNGIDATPERVILTWVAATAAGSIAVYRRTEQSTWQSVGSAVPEGPSQLRFEDDSVTPGGRYAYRLGIANGAGEIFTAETWVDVPNDLRLALEGFRPNPAHGVPVAAFTLPNAIPARIELYDVAGRVVASREVGSMGPGRHIVDLSATGRLAAGVYWMRLSQLGRSLVARGIVIQ